MGTMAQTAMKREARSLIGPTAGARSGKSCYASPREGDGHEKRSILTSDTDD